MVKSHGEFAFCRAIDPPEMTCVAWFDSDLGFGWVVVSAVGSVGVWGVWVGRGLVWMGCVVFAAALLWGGRLLAAGHQFSNTVRPCW